MFLSPASVNASVDLSVCVPSTVGYIQPVEEVSAKVIKPQSANPHHHDHTYFSKYHMDSISGKEIPTKGRSVGTSTSVKQKTHVSQQKDALIGISVKEKDSISRQHGASISTSTSVKQKAPMSGQKGTGTLVKRNVSVSQQKASTKQKLPVSQEEVVTLYNKYHQPVGCGKVVHSDTEIVHGRKVRDDCVKVII